jgi:ammonium transporter, Amt family
MSSEFLEARLPAATKAMLRAWLVLAILILSVAWPGAASAQSAEPAKPDAVAAALAGSDAKSVDERLGDLEAYMNNTARVAKESKVAGPGPGHNAWMMVCAALVLFMTLPGLALFYGGMVRAKNVLSVMAQCLAMAGVVTILWVTIGYSLVFSPGSPFLGSAKFAMFAGVDAMPNGDYAQWVSQNVFAMYQLMFAIITPALIVGAIAERMKFSALMIFTVAWMFIVYFPLAHMVWGIDGLMNGVWNPKASIKAIDFAGGTVVHMSSGWSAIVLALIIGKRRGFGKESFAPHSLVLTMVGTGMLWVGWYGFNAGSAVAADTIAANAFVTTTIAAAVGCVAWPAAEWLTRGKPTVLGFCSGAVGGLVVITPAAGFVTPVGAMIIGVLAGVIPFLACTKLKNALGYDDALDTFGVHAIGGTMGALLTGFLATADANPNLTANLKGIVGHTLWLEQLKAMGFTIAMAGLATTGLAYALKATIGLRPTDEDEEIGLDLTDHGERGYHTSEYGGGHPENADDSAGGHAAAH